MTTMTRALLLGFAVAAAGLGCPAEDDGDDPQTDSQSASMTGTASTSGTAGSVTSASASGSSVGTTTDDATDGTGAGTGAMGCAVLDEAGCLAQPDVCMAISGRPIVADASGPCLGAAQFIECQPSADCGEALSYACEEADGATIYEFPNTCTPAGWVGCEPPPVELAECE